MADEIPRPPSSNSSKEGDAMKLSKRFTARLEKSPAKGGWTFMW